MQCKTCGETKMGAGIDTPVTGTDRFCSSTCLEADPRWQREVADAIACFGLFTCHGLDGRPYNGTHWCGRITRN